MFNVIIIPHIHADSTVDFDIYLSVLQILGSALSYSALAALTDFLELTSPYSAVAHISGGAIALLNWTSGTWAFRRVFGIDIRSDLLSLNRLILIAFFFNR